MQGCAIAVVMAGLVLGADSPAEVLKKEQAALQGTWIVESAVMGKQKLDFFDGVSLKLAGDNKASMKHKDKTMEGTYKLDPAKSPKELDITFKASNGKSETSPMLYELKDGKLILAMGVGEGSSEGGKEKTITPPKRPTKLDDPHSVTMTLVREKK